MNFGVKVVNATKNILTATGIDILLTTKYPHMKLDTNLSTSFSDFTFTFNSDPPIPTGVFPDVDKITTVYTYAHGYNYVPSIWSLIQVTTAVASNFYQPYFQSAGVLSAHTAFDDAAFFVYADATNIYFKVDKYYDNRFGNASTNNLIGTVLDIRVYVFADDI